MQPFGKGEGEEGGKRSPRLVWHLLVLLVLSLRAGSVHRSEEGAAAGSGAANPPLGLNSPPLSALLRCAGGRKSLLAQPTEAGKMWPSWKRPPGAQSCSCWGVAWLLLLRWRLRMRRSTGPTFRRVSTTTWRGLPQQRRRDRSPTASDLRVRAKLEGAARVAREGLHFPFPP